MDEKRFVKVLWIAKAALVAVLLYVGFEVVTNRVHLGRDREIRELRRAVANIAAAPPRTCWRGSPHLPRSVDKGVGRVVAD